MEREIGWQKENCFLRLNGSKTWQKDEGTVWNNLIKYNEDSLPNLLFVF